jgi:hypothetical protein
VEATNQNYWSLSRTSTSHWNLVYDQKQRSGMIVLRNQLTCTKETREEDV